MSNKVTEASVDPEVREVARRAYKAYARNSDGKTYDGKPMPTWETLTPVVRGHWCAAMLGGLDDVVHRIGSKQGSLIAELEQKAVELQRKLAEVAEKLDAVTKTQRSEAKAPPAGVHVEDASLARVLVVVNGVSQYIDKSDITYEEIVALCNLSGHPTVTYAARRVGDTRRSGEMHVGSAPLKLEDGMVINAIHTGNA